MVLKNYDEYSNITYPSKNIEEASLTKTKKRGAVGKLLGLIKSAASSPSSKKFLKKIVIDTFRKYSSPSACSKAQYVFYLEELGDEPRFPH